MKPLRVPERPAHCAGALFYNKEQAVYGPYILGKFKPRKNPIGQAMVAAKRVRHDN